MAETTAIDQSQYPKTVHLYDRLYDRIVEATILSETAASYRVNFSGKANADTEFEAGTGTTYIKKSVLEDRRREPPADA